MKDRRTTKAAMGLTGAVVVLLALPLVSGANLLERPLEQPTPIAPVPAVDPAENSLEQFELMVEIIRSSPDAEIARQRLIQRFELREDQARAILDYVLRTLARRQPRLPVLDPHGEDAPAGPALKRPAIPEPRPDEPTTPVPVATAEVSGPTPADSPRKHRSYRARAARASAPTAGAAQESFSFTAVCDPCAQKTFGEGGKVKGEIKGPLTAESTFGAGQLDAPGAPSAVGGKTGFKFTFTMTFDGGTVTGSGFMPLRNDNKLSGTWEATGGTCNVKGSGQIGGDTRGGQTSAFLWRLTGEVTPTGAGEACKAVASGGGGGGSSENSNASGPSADTGSSSDSGDLPLTGTDVLRVALVGLLLLVGGLALRTPSMKRPLGWTSAAAFCAVAIGLGACGGSDGGNGGGDGAAKSDQTVPSGPSGSSVAFGAICDPCAQKTFGEGGKVKGEIKVPLTAASTFGSGRVEAKGAPSVVKGDTGFKFDFTMTFDGGTVTGSGFMPLRDDNKLSGPWKATGGTCNVTGSGQIGGNTRGGKTSAFLWRLEGKVTPAGDDQPCSGGAS